MTRRSSTIRTTISPTLSKNMIENTGRFGVSTVFESSVSKSFSLVILFLKRKARKARNRETLARERKRRKRRFWDQWCRVDVKERLTERYLCESEESQKILFSRVSENSTLLFEISEDTWNEELNKLFFFGKIQFRENFLNDYIMESQNLKRRNSEHSLFEPQRLLESQRRQLLKANQ